MTRTAAFVRTVLVAGEVRETTGFVRQEGNELLVAVAGHAPFTSVLASEAEASAAFEALVNQSA